MLARTMLLALMLATLLASIASEPAPAAARGDFPPFVMTIAYWDEVQIRYADGRTAGGTQISRLEYLSRSDWTITHLTNEVPAGPVPPDSYACRGARYGHLAQNGVFTAGGRTGSERICPAPDRWISHGVAEHWHWAKEVADGSVTYTDPGERVVFDLRTGLPTLYEAGTRLGGVKHRRTYRLDWIASGR